MPKPWIPISFLGLALVGTNAWWVYQVFDDAVSKSHLVTSLDDNKEALEQALVLMPYLAQSGHTKSEIINAAQKTTSRETTFERDGVVWVGKIGFQFNDKDQLVKVLRAWSPP
jgi:hypothetical protein